MSQAGRTLVTLAAAGIALVIAAWFDSTILQDAGLQAESGPAGLDTLTALTVLGSVLVAGSVLLLGLLAWRSVSAVVGVAYVVVGGFFAALPWLWWNVARMDQGIVPEPLAVAVRELGASTTGSLNAVGTIGAGMLIAGVAALARSWRGRAGVMRHAGIEDAAAGPALP